MRIHYHPNEGMVVSLAPDEVKSIVRATEALISAFEEDNDVSFLRWVLETAKYESNHTLN